MFKTITLNKGYWPKKIPGLKYGVRNSRSLVKIHTVNEGIEIDDLVLSLRF